MGERFVKLGQHEHTFGLGQRRAGEVRTWLVIVVTAVTMVVEVTAGVLLGSMALLADGLHMASHAAALAITAFAYRYTRRHAADGRFNFGTGKVNSLAAFASAVVLVLFAGLMAWESVERFIWPVGIKYDQAIVVAVVGLMVNGVSLWLLREPGGVGHGHQGEGHVRHGRGGDHALWSAYLHVLADTVTSLLAIGALVAGKYVGLGWLDPLMGLVAGALVTRWSWGLLGASSRVLLDMRPGEGLEGSIRKALEEGTNDRIADLHVWAIGPDMYAAEIAVVSREPRSPQAYRAALPAGGLLRHVTIEVYTDGDAGGGA